MTGTSQVGSKSSPYPCCIKGNWKEISPIFADKRVVIATGFGLTVAWNYALRVCWLDPATILRQTFPWSCIVLVAQICTTCCLKDKPVAFYLLSFQLSNLVVGLLQFRCWSEMNVWGKRLLWSGIATPLGGITIFYRGRTEKEEHHLPLDHPAPFRQPLKEVEPPKLAPHPFLEKDEQRYQTASDKDIDLSENKDEENYPAKIRKKIAITRKLKEEVISEREKMPTIESLRELCLLGILTASDIKKFLSNKGMVFDMDCSQSEEAQIKTLLNDLGKQEERPLNNGKEVIEKAIGELNPLLGILDQVEEALDESLEVPPKPAKLRTVLMIENKSLRSFIPLLQSQLKCADEPLKEEVRKRISTSSSSEEFDTIQLELSKSQEHGVERYDLSVEAGSRKDEASLVDQKKKNLVEITKEIKKIKSV